MLDIIAFWVRLGLFFVGGTENGHRKSVKFRIHVIYIMQRTSGVKYLVIYGKKLGKLPRVFYLPNSGCRVKIRNCIFLDFMQRRREIDKEFKITEYNIKEITLFSIYFEKY